MDKSKIEEIVKGLVKEMAKAGTAEDAAEDTGIPKRSIEVGKVTFSKDGDTKFTVTDIDDVTGKVSWIVEQLPSFEELFSTATDLVNVAKGVRNETKGDNFFREIYETSKLLRNKIRTHLRNEYPDEYNRIVMRLSENELPSVSDISDLQDRRVDAVAKAISEKYDIKDDGRLRGTIRMALADHIFEDEVEEISTSGAAGAYLTPYAFRLKGSKPNDKAYKELGYKEVKENESPSLNAKIYAEDMMRQYRKMYRIVDGNFGSEAADEFKNIVKSKMSQLQEGVGATLGPGPKASSDGVKDNSYVKEFGYKLVPKKIKGSGLEVKQIF